MLSTVGEKALQRWTASEGTLRVERTNEDPLFTEGAVAR